MKKKSRRPKTAAKPVSPKVSKPLSRRKARVFRAAMIAIPALFFVFLEITLRLAGYGKTIPLFKTFEANAAYYAINPEAGRRYFPSTNVTPAVAATDVFLKQKPAGGFRIFVLGGSTAAGYPYLYNGSFSSILKAILKAYYPERYLEIVNLAMPAVTSYAVRNIALELAPYQPDLILVYAGHNEFYGGLGVASTESLGHSRALVNLYLGLGSYKTLQLAGEGLLWLRNGFNKMFGEPAAPPSGTLMERMAQRRAIPYGSAPYRRAGEIFQGNLGDVIEYCRQNRVPLLIGSLVSNVRDQKPFMDVFAGPTTEKSWREQYRAAEALYQSGKFNEALQALQRCAALDSLPASQYFLQGEIYGALGDTPAAYEAFYRAKDFDGLRFRAAEEINRRIYEMGKKTGVTVVPVKEAFEAASPGGLPGKSLLLEHLHPNLAGYIRMAKTFAEAILNGKFPGTPAAERVPDSLWLPNVGVTAVDEEVARIRVEALTRGWPFTPGSPPSKEEYRIPNADFIQNLALQFWREELSWEQMHVQAAEYYTREKQPGLAEKEYRALIHAIPLNSSPYLFLGRLLMEQQRYEEALATLQACLQYQPEVAALKMIGNIYLAKREPGKAVVYLEQAVKISPHDMAALLNLARGYALAGDFERAQPLVQQVLRSRADLPEAKTLAEFIARELRRQGR